LFRGFAKFNPSVFGWRGENQKHFGKSYCFEAVSRSFGGRAASAMHITAHFYNLKKKFFTSTKILQSTLLATALA
jgi:hypothetical protein